jgi:hypothetical protein
MASLNYISEVENSTNYLIINIKGCVNDYITMHFVISDDYFDLEARDKAVMYVYKTYMKKYYHDSRYIENPTLIIKQIINSYYSSR